ncbi:uncharacterized protein [Nicotiana tomentosiformis]|nr:uncharacterized protein LOC104113843 isoform X2 [Nicotiana tomentosiformis]
MPQKSDKSFGKVPNNSNAYAANSAGNLNSHSGKENYQHIWQRIQKKDANVSNCDLKNSDFSQVHDGLNDDIFKTNLPIFVDVILSSKSAFTDQEKLKFLTDLSRNNSPGSLQENKSKYGKGSPVNGACLNCTMQSNGAVNSAGQIGGAKNLRSAADSRTETSTLKIRYQKKNVQYVSSQPYSNPCSCNMEARGDVPVPISVSSVDNKMVEDGSNLLCRSANFHNPTEQLASKCQPPSSSSLHVVINAGQNLESLPGVTQFKKLRNCNTCTTTEEHYKNAASSKLLIPGDKARIFSSLQNDFRSICWAVTEAHRAQLSSEAIELGKGYPVAEFEKLLYFASPVVCPHIRTCQACVSGQGAPLCRHEIPNISLGNLWQWYEKHGSYGLEVKAEDHRSCRQCGIDRLKFSAYFVPLFSGVQLFKYHRTHTSYKDNGTPGSIDVVDSGINKISEGSPMVDLRTIFSVLVPQPRVEDSSSLQKRNVVSDSCSSQERSNTDLHHPPVEFKLSDDNVELLFEYFEREQPQNRKPLFEKIQELVAGNLPSSSGVYGDPSVLQSSRLSDLHPYSWFSVAWYPIYKIPNGNLRSAFLTYHSLGHYVGRGHTLEARHLDACIVSPVVGLQSYNAQGECWFQPRHCADHLKEVTLDSDPCSVLRDRLKTLEQTASLMSRAVRTSGTETLVNRHPDYEFFLSRQRELP